MAAGKAVAERNRLNREAQRKALADAAIIIENNKKAKPPAPEPAPETEPKPAAADSEGFTTNQWLTMIGFGVMILTTYVKREDIKVFFGKEKASPPEPAPQVTHESPPQTRKGIRNMD